MARSRLRKAKAGNPEKPVERSLTWRANFLYGMTFLACLSLILRLGYLQIARGEEFRQTAATAREDTIPVLPARGRIYDANGNLLAYDKPAYALYLANDRSLKPQFPAIAAKLAPVLKVKESDLLETMQKQTYLSQIELATGLTDQQLAWVEEHRSELPGVDVMVESQRTYPYGVLAGQVLGYTGPITAETKAHYVDELGYLQTQKVGVAGLELQYESVLQGKKGKQIVQVNSNGNPIQTLDYDPAPVPGANLQLTLDGHLQAIAQQALMDAVEKSKYSENIHDAEAVVLDVKTGGVLAMVSYPYLDPNWYIGGSKTLNPHLHYLATSGAQLNNVIQSPRTPGSTVKMANLVTALKNGIVTPNTVFQDHTITRIGADARLSDNGEYHGLVTPVKAIAVSCDTFFYEVGLWLGKWMGADASSGGGFTGASSYREWLNTQFARGITTLFQGERDFGLGAKTGIDLPYEAQGRFYVEDSRKQMQRVQLDLDKAEASLKKNGSYPLYGSPADLAFAGIGQTQQFTPIELAQYVATIANNGVRLQPHLVAKIVPQDGSPPQEIKPVVQAKLNIPAQYLKIVQEGMHEATTVGTAAGAFQGAPYAAAGKTGTAQITEGGVNMDNSVFVGYAPFDNPQIAVCVMVPGAGYGAETAAPVARQLMDAYFQEHHQFFPKEQWSDTQIPADYKMWSSYVKPEQAK
ncbi:peptidoglycan D,D-transpeptidase FtsI family protein [Alicyclobacillus macrosporangiidus]|uniref:Penicillin-binding protein 2 n=1 Tax=Alicyclobacillus macrosporangiidus TaxID=392015 RepID=A0A1I7JKZ1_9BACL|nr:penicillin-binding transpeptidase domain-containing protein [Alicyclobacillus macrosporangiidus]SFU85842.1 penicillin-binding protein 2 [Alicyclobacillus macrosporangiidus]